MRRSTSAFDAYDGLLCERTAGWVTWTRMSRTSKTPKHSARKTRTGELWDATKLLTGHRCGKRNFACSHTANEKMESRSIASSNRQVVNRNSDENPSHDTQCRPPAARIHYRVHQKHDRGN